MKEKLVKLLYWVLLKIDPYFVNNKLIFVEKQKIAVICSSKRDFDSWFYKPGKNYVWVPNLDKALGHTFTGVIIHNHFFDKDSVKAYEYLKGRFPHLFNEQWLWKK